MSDTAIGSSNVSNRAGHLIRRFIAGTGPLIVLLVMVVALWIAAPAFRTPTSIMLIGLEAASLGLVAAGQTFVILTGGIDLSVEAMVSFSGVVAAILIAGTNIAGGQIAHGIPSWEAVLIALAAGLAIGLLQGVMITQLKMNPFIVTLGFRSMLLGVCLVWTRGAGINIQKDALLAFLTGTFKVANFPVPMPLIVALIVYFACWFALRHTKFGRYNLCHRRQRDGHPAVRRQRRRCQDPDLRCQRSAGLDQRHPGDGPPGLGRLPERN